MIGQGRALYQYCTVLLNEWSGQRKPGGGGSVTQCQGHVFAFPQCHSEVRFGSASQTAVHDNNEEPAEASPARATRE